MDKSYLIKRKSLLLAGIQEDGVVDNIVPFSNMALATGTNTDPTHVILATEEGMKDYVGSSIAGAHKQIVGDVEVSTDTEATSIVASYNSGANITLKDGSTYSQGIAVAGDVIFFVKKNLTDTFKPEEAIVLSDLSMTLMSTANADDVRLGKVEVEQGLQFTRIGAIETEDANNLKIDNLKDVDTIGSINQTGTETKHIANREDVRQVVVAVKGELAGNAQTLTMTQLEAADVLLRTRLDAIEKENANGKKVFDTGATLANGDYAPKKNMVVFDDLLVDGSQVILTDIPATSMDGGIAYVADDFNMNTATPPQGPEVQLVIYGDESDPTTTEDSLDAEWTGTQTFGTTRAGKLHGIDMTTGHWSANFVINNDGVVVMTGFKAAIDPATSKEYPVKRLILVQSTLDTTQSITVPYYSKTETDAKIAAVDLSSKQDKISNSLSTTSKDVVGGINELKAQQDKNTAALVIDATTMVALETKLGV